MNYYNQNGRSQKKKSFNGVNNDSFLEALRGLGSGIVKSVKNDLLEGITQEAKNQFSASQNELQPGQTIDLKENTPKQTRFTPEFNLQYQEKTLWSNEKEEIRWQIAQILKELKKLAQATQNLSKEVDIAIEQTPVEPGKYHLSFLEKLKQTLVLLRKRVTDSATWLAAFNQKVRKRNYYWAQVRKSGTKFMLSQERYMATQVG